MLRADGVESATMTPRELSERRNRCPRVRAAPPAATARESCCAVMLDMFVLFFLEWCGLDYSIISPLRAQKLHR